MTELPPQLLLKKIEAQVRMRPKWVFWLEHAALVAAVVLAAVGLVFFGSLISYLWRTAQLGDLPAFGPGGGRLFVREFPWWEAGLVVAGIGAFMYLLRRYTKLYRWPLAVIVGVFVGAFLLASAVANVTRLHDVLANRSIRGGVPVIGPLYGRGMMNGLITVGTIEKASGSTWTVKTEDGSIKVKISDETRRPLGWTPAQGDDVVVIGERDGSTIEAVGIRPAKDLPDRRPFRMHRPMMEYPRDGAI